MSTTIKVLANKTAVVDRDEASTHFSPSATMHIEDSQDVLFAFEAFPSEHRFKRILSSWFYAKTYYQGSSSGLEVAYVGTQLSAVDYDTVTWATRPEYEANTRYGNSSSLRAHNEWDFHLATPDGGSIATVQNGAYLVHRYSYDIKTSLAGATDRPYVEFELSNDINHVDPICTPSSGYQNPHQDIVLKWGKSTAWSSYETPVQTAAVVTWKETGGAEHTISVTTEREVTIPAGTWSNGTTYEWKVAITDTGGSTTTMGWYTLSTTAAAATPPTLEYPVADVIDGTGDVTFRWVNNGGENNAGTDLEFSTDGTTWGSPINVAAGVSEYIVAAGTLPSGTNYWRARAYNADSTAGSWTDATIFTVISSPQAPYYEVTNTPRPTITWVSDEQQAFQVQMGDYDSGLVFGTDQSFKCPVYLPNGSTTVRVRVMNAYNLWSDWSGTQITIANTPGDAPPVLTVTAGTDAQLSWTTAYNTTAVLSSDLTWEIGKSINASGNLYNVSYFCRSGYFDLNGAEKIRYTGPETGPNDKPYSVMIAFYNGSTFLERPYFSDFPGGVAIVPETATRARAIIGYASSLGEAATQGDADNFSAALYMTEASNYVVYRNGAQIGETDGLSYTDRYANGQTSYFVRAVLNGDNYAQSNTVSVELSVPCPMITAIDGNWIELQYSTEPIYTAQNTHTQQVSMMVYSGSVYPVPEIAPHRQRSYQIAVAFRRGESGPFEALLGRECYLKDQYGAAIHGVISAIATAHNRFYTVCSATLEEMEGSL